VLLTQGIPAYLQAEAGPRSPSAVPAQTAPQNPPPEQPQTSPTPQPVTTTTTTSPQSGGPINLFEAAARAAAQRGGPGVPRPAAPVANPVPVPPTGGAGAGAGAGGLTAGMGGNLEALRNNPNFLQLRNIVQSNPQLLEPIIQNIAQGNPQFAQLITQNPEAFLQLLAEGGEEGEGGALPPGAIQVTPEEAEAIGRVVWIKRKD
jgi:UV excision repair protein RAD23